MEQHVHILAGLLPVRDQGRRPSCLVFASSAAHELKVAQTEHLSVEYLYYHAVARTPGSNPAGGTSIAAVGAALSSEGQPVEDVWPYTLVQTTPWIPPTGVEPTLKVSLKQNKLGFEEIVAILNGNCPVVLGLVITDAFFRPDDAGRVIFRTQDAERCGHAVLAVGYRVSEAGGQEALLIRNSWGDGWGIGGYAWLPRDYVERQLHETAVLT